MNWTAEQQSMRLDQLAAIFTAIDQRHVSNDAARKTISRWVDQGWAESRVLLQGQPAFVWLTTAGMRLTGYDYPAGEPALGTLTHTAITTDIRLWLLARYPNGWWRSERAMRSLLPRRTRDTPVAHLPDGEYHARNGAIVAIENELTPKTIERTRRIMLGLLSRKYDYDQQHDIGTGDTPRYKSIWYFTAPAAHNVVQAARDTLPEDYTGRLVIHEWPHA